MILLYSVNVFIFTRSRSSRVSGQGDCDRATDYREEHEHEDGRGCRDDD